MTSKERLEQYVKEDEIYNEYLDNNKSYISDFDRFCIEHCQDIKNILEENEELKKQLEEYKKELEKADSITQSCIFNGKEDSKISFRKCLNMLEEYKNQQKKFIKYLEDEKWLYEINTQGYSMNLIGKVLSKYKEIIGNLGE